MASDDLVARDDGLASGEAQSDVFGPALTSQVEQLAALSNRLSELDLDALEETIRAAARLPLNEHTQERLEYLLEAWLPDDSEIDPWALIAVLDKHQVEDVLARFSFSEPFSRRLQRISHVFWPQLESVYEVIHLGAKDWRRVSSRQVQGKLELVIERRDMAVFQLETYPDSFVGLITRLLGILAHIPDSLRQGIDDSDWSMLQDMWEHAHEESKKAGQSVIETDDRS